MLVQIAAATLRLSCHGADLQLLTNVVGGAGVARPMRAYVTAAGIALGLVGMWAALVPFVA